MAQNIAETLSSPHTRPHFSFEILPPLKGNNIKKVFNVIDRMMEFDPLCVNITSHHSDIIYQQEADGRLRKVRSIKRPGTVAIAAAIQAHYNITAVPHLICMGFTPDETEYALLDLNFLGINNLFLLRGDSKNLEPKADGSTNRHATDLQSQVNDFNRGIGLDNITLEGIETPFSYGMACYPEKHEEAPNFDSDIRYLKQKVANGAGYLVTQMFFDNEKYFSFVDRCRHEGINVPIIPGIKPIVLKSQLNVLPRVFRTDIPEPLALELEKCTSDAQVKEVGVEWCLSQCRELVARGVPGLHFYTLLASDSVARVAKELF